MSEPRDKSPGRGERRPTDALRDAIERTLEATAAPAASSRERAGKLFDEIARRGREAREELTRRGQQTQDELTRRGQATRDELARQLETLEGRLASIEELLRRQIRRREPEDSSNPEVED